MLPSYAYRTVDSLLNAKRNVIVQESTQKYEDLKKVKCIPRKLDRYISYCQLTSSLLRFIASKVPRGDISIICSFKLISHWDQTQLKLSPMLTAQKTIQMQEQPFQNKYC